MTETELKIMDTFKRAIPFMTEIEKSNLLAFGEGLAFFTCPQEQGKAAAQPRPGRHDEPRGT